MKRCKVLELHVSGVYNSAISGTLIQIEIEWDEMEL